jgi:hypothetical protein
LLITARQPPDTKTGKPYVDIDETARTPGNRVVAIRRGSP